MQDLLECPPIPSFFPSDRLTRPYRRQDLLEWRNDQHGRNGLLMTYVRYQCGLPQGSAEHPTAAGGISAAQHRSSSLPRPRAFSR